MSAPRFTGPRAHIERHDDASPTQLRLWFASMAYALLYAVPQPASGAALPSVSPPQRTLAARPPDTRRRNAQQTRHHPKAHRDPIFAASRSPQPRKVPAPLASPDATSWRDRRTARKSLAEP